tara:strand:+ start:1972 stop:2439 length:468 start_codon:yes stop_codon:yes gene_type:complete
MQPLVKRDMFNIVKNITWDDLMSKIQNECDDFREGPTKPTLELHSKNGSPSLVCRNEYYPNTILSAYNEVLEKIPITTMHIYTSFSLNYEPFGNHADDTNILIVQARGTMSYSINDKDIHLNPGDALIIPKGVYHKPNPSGLRVTLSFDLGQKMY